MSLPDSNWKTAELARQLAQRKELYALIGRALEIAKEHERLYGDLQGLTVQQISEALGIL